MANIPKAFNANNYSLWLGCSLIKYGIIGINPFMKIGSIPIDLLNVDLPKNAIFFTRSPIKS